MTRWARAHGSKGANEKLPEQATDWSQLKKGIIKQYEESEGDLHGESDEEGVDGEDEGFNGKDEKEIEIDGKRETVWADLDNLGPDNLIEEGTDVSLEMNEDSRHSDLPQVSETILAEERNEGRENSPTTHTESRGPFQEFSRTIRKNCGIRKEGDLSEGKHLKNVIVNGETVDVVYFEGVRMKKVDADRIKELRRSLFDNGVSKHVVKQMIKLERRKAEKALTNLKKKLCFLCREPGHLLVDCKKAGVGVCYSCGSFSHMAKDCKVSSSFSFATCFICQKEGHIAKQCPDNTKGIYPNGGACRMCGDVTHFKKDCPLWQKKKAESNITLKTVANSCNIDELDDNRDTFVQTPPRKKPRVVKI